MTSQAGLPWRLMIPRCSHQSHFAFGPAQSAAVPEPNRLALGQLAPLAACAYRRANDAVAVQRTPMVVVLMLSNTIIVIAAIARVIMVTYRLYQPDTRAMWSSYQCSTEDRNWVLSPLAFVARASREVRSVRIESGSQSSPLNCPQPLDQFRNYS